jgi:WD40 repeat protein
MARIASLILLPILVWPGTTLAQEPQKDKLPTGALRRFGTTHLRHERGVQSVACSPDGKLILSSGDERVMLRDSGSGKERTLASYSSIHPMALAFSPDGKQLAFEDLTPGRVTLVSENGEKFRWTATHGAALNQIVFSPDGKLLASAGDDKAVCLWDIETGKQRFRLEGHTEKVQAIAFFPDGKTIVSGSKDKTLRFWDTATGKEKRNKLERDEDNGGMALWVADDASVLVMVTHHGAWGPAEAGTVIRRIELPSGKELSKKGGGETSTAVAVAPDGKKVALGPRTGVDTDNPIAFVNSAVDKSYPLWHGHTAGINSMAWSADGKTLVSGSIDGTVRVWVTASGKECGEVHAHTRAVTKAIFSRDGGLLATGGKDNTVCLWDTKTGKCLHRLFGHQDWLRSLAFSPNGKYLITSAFRRKTDGQIPDSKARLWNVTTGEEVREFERIHGDAAFTSDGKAIIVANDEGNACLMPIAKDEEPRNLAPQAFYGTYAVSPDGKLLASGEGWEGIHLWRISSGSYLQKLDRKYERGIRSLAFSPDSRLLAAGGVGEITLWESATGGELLHWKTKSDDVDDIGYAADSRLVVSSNGFKGVVTFYDAATGKKHHELGKSALNPTYAVFSPDGKSVATGHGDGTLLLWKSAELVKPPVLEAAKTPVKVDDLWAAMAGKDAAAAYKARWELTAIPEQAVPYLRQRLKPVAPPDADVFARHLADLGSEQFKVRDKATVELAKLEDAAAGMLRKALDPKQTLEVRRRIEELVRRLEDLTLQPETLRALRAVAVLENIGTEPARGVLRDLAGGAEGARVTEAARAALQRLNGEKQR